MMHKTEMPFEHANTDPKGQFWQFFATLPGARLVAPPRWVYDCAVFTQGERHGF